MFEFDSVGNQAIHRMVVLSTSSEPRKNKESGHYYCCVFPIMLFCSCSVRLSTNHLFFSFSAQLLPRAGIVLCNPFDNTRYIHTGIYMYSQYGYVDFWKSANNGTQLEQESSRCLKGMSSQSIQFSVTNLVVAVAVYVPYTYVYIDYELKGRGERHHHHPREISKLSNHPARTPVSIGHSLSKER